MTGILSLDLMHLVTVLFGIALTLAYQKWGIKLPAPAGSPPGSPSGTPAPIIIPGRPVLTMLLALLHKVVDGSAPQDVQPNPAAPLDLQAELLILLQKLQIQQNGTSAKPQNLTASKQE